MLWFALVTTLSFCTVNGAKVACNAAFQFGESPLVVMQTVTTIYAANPTLMNAVTVQTLPTFPPMQSKCATLPTTASSQNLTFTTWLYGTMASEFLYVLATSATVCKVPILYPFVNARNGTDKVALQQQVIGAAFTPQVVNSGQAFTLSITSSGSHTWSALIASGYSFFVGLSEDGNCTVLLMQSQSPTVSSSTLSTTVMGLSTGFYSVCLLILYNSVNKTAWFPLSMPLGSSAHNLQVGLANFAATGAINVFQNSSLTGSVDRLLYNFPLTLYMDAVIFNQGASFNYFAIDTSLDLCNPNLIYNFRRTDVVALNSTTYSVNTSVNDAGPNSAGGGYAVLCGSMTAVGPWMLLSTNYATIYACKIGFWSNGSCYACEVTGPGPSDYCYNRGVCGYGNTLRPDFTSVQSVCQCNTYFDVGASVYYGRSCQFAYLNYPKLSLTPNRTYSGTRFVTLTAADTNETIRVQFPNGTVTLCNYTCTLKLSAPKLVPGVKPSVYALSLSVTHVNGSATYSTQNATYTIAALTRTQSNSPTPEKTRTGSGASRSRSASLRPTRSLTETQTDASGSWSLRAAPTVSMTKSSYTGTARTDSVSQLLTSTRTIALAKRRTPTRTRPKHAPQTPTSSTDGTASATKATQSRSHVTGTIQTSASLTWNTALLNTACYTTEGWVIVQSNVSVVITVTPATATLPPYPTSLVGTSILLQNWPCNTQCQGVVPCDTGVVLDCQTGTITFTSVQPLVASGISCNMTMPIYGLPYGVTNTTGEGGSSGSAGVNGTDPEAGGTVTVRLPILLGCAPIVLDNVWLPSAVLPEGASAPIVIVHYDPSRGLATYLSAFSNINVAVPCTDASADLLVVQRNGSLATPVVAVILQPKVCLRFQSFLDASAPNWLLPTTSNVVIPNLWTSIPNTTLNPSTAVTPTSAPTTTNSSTSSPDAVAVNTSPPIVTLAPEAPSPSAPGLNGSSFTNMPSDHGGDGTDGRNQRQGVKPPSSNTAVSFAAVFAPDTAEGGRLYLMSSALVGLLVTLVAVRATVRYGVFVEEKEPEAEPHR